MKLLNFVFIFLFGTVAFGRLTDGNFVTEISVGSRIEFKNLHLKIIQGQDSSVLARAKINGNNWECFVTFPPSSRDMEFSGNVEVVFSRNPELNYDVDYGHSGFQFSGLKIPENIRSFRCNGLESASLYFTISELRALLGSGGGTLTL